jgi:hypothetical protein
VDESRTSVGIELMNAYERGEFTVDGFVAEVKATNAGRH